jgi:hypothetical protein
VKRLRLCYAVLFICGLPAVACNRPTERADIAIVKTEISPQPARVGTVMVTFSLVEGALPVTGAQVRIEADMSHPGMSPVFADAHEVQSGRYQSQLALSMAGDWVVLVHGTLANGKAFDGQLTLSGVKAE